MDHKIFCGSATVDPRKQVSFGPVATSTICIMETDLTNPKPVAGLSQTSQSKIDRVSAALGLSGTAEEDNNLAMTMSGSGGDIDDI